MCNKFPFIDIASENIAHHFIVCKCYSRNENLLGISCNPGKQIYVASEEQELNTTLISRQRHHVHNANIK